MKISFIGTEKFKRALLYCLFVLFIGAFINVMYFFIPQIPNNFNVAEIVTCVAFVFIGAFIALPVAPIFLFVVYCFIDKNWHVLKKKLFYSVALLILMVCYMVVLYLFGKYFLGFKRSGKLFLHIDQVIISAIISSIIAPFLGPIKHNQ